MHGPRSTTDPAMQTLSREPLQATKLHIPSPRAQLVSRPRLLQCLDQGLSAHVVLVSAPAGFGKTTLLSEWVNQVRSSERSDAPAFCWLSLDPRDNDPVRFFSYLIAALPAVAPGTGDTVREALHSPQPPPVESVLIVLLNELAALPAGRPYVLILDDYHLVEAQVVHRALAFLLDHVPPQMCVVLATRADPPLPLSRWRSRGQMLELMADGRSNRDIAQELIVAVGTVKTHIHNICGKLGVQNRTQAVMRANELGLLGGASRA